MLTLDVIQRRAAITRQVQEFQLHRSTAYTERLVWLLDAVIEDTLFDLATVEPARLQFKQGALAQLKALREVVLSNESATSPKAV